MRTLSLSLSSALLMASGVAHAGFPTGETWFESSHNFGLDDCTFDSVDVCDEATSTRYQCVMNRIDDGGLGAWATIIRNESNVDQTDICNGFDYCGFGAVTTGATTEETFFCAWDGDDYETITLVGTSQNDLLFFHFTGNGEYDLEEHSGVSTVDGEILGLAGDDEVHGSRHVSAAYKDWLYGGDGADTIWGHEGNDRIYSGEGIDVVWGGPGNDIIYLAGDSNTVSAEDGNDVVHGGPGTDYVHGGDGDDVLYGHEGNDVLCGGDGNDTLEGGSQNDKLWSGSTTESEDGGPGTDACTDGGGGTSCENPLYTPPTECPPEHES
jgi:Ca2+-binding RTX toxin-like protein